MSDLELTMMRRVGELNKENARLKAEVEELKDALFKHSCENYRLQIQRERLTTAGDAMADEIVGCFNAEGYDPADSDALTNWLAAKEGKGQP
jgi:regulator of replication initiation timing